MIYAGDNGYCSALDYEVPILPALGDVFAETLEDAFKFRFQLTCPRNA